MNKTNFGVQLLPCVMVLAAIAFYALAAAPQCYFCLIIAVFMWVLLFPSERN